MENKIIIGIVTVVISIIVLAGVLIPTLNNSTDKTLTYYNEGVAYMIADPDSIDNHVIVVDADGITSDGETIDASPYLTGDYTIVFGEHSILRYSPANGRVSFGGTLGQGTAGVWTEKRTGDSEETLTITITGDTMVMVNGETETTVTDNWAFVSTAGEYRYLVNPCVTSTDRIIGGGVTYSPFSSATVICFDGTIEAINAGIYRSSPAATLNSYEVQTSVIKGDLVKIDAIKFNATQNSNDVTATYTYFLAPHEITYNNPAYIGDDYAGIIGVIPLLVVVAVLLAAISLFIIRRSE